MEINEFINKNIFLINRGIKNFCKEYKDFTEVQIKEYLKNKIFEEMKDSAIRNSIINDFMTENCKKSKIISIANKYIYYFADLEKFFKHQFLLNVGESLGEETIQILANNTLEKIKKLTKIESNKLNFIKKYIESLLKKAYFLVSQGGFVKNIVNINDGIMTANAGDSAQFLFVSRAILAGFNCSNVDVRSSKYDAIIDYNNKLLRIQIKGVTSTDTISFFDRARGGQGIDYKHERNQGKRITSENCDLYVAVDKQIGICYIIPMKYADTIPDDNAKRVPLKELYKYRENWNIIKETLI